MNDKPVTILIATYDSHEAGQLAIESVRAKTKSAESVSIAVYDSPASLQDRPYYEQLLRAGKIRLVGGTDNLGHGPAMWRLLNACQTEWAVLFDSDCEVRNALWLRALFAQVENEQTDIGVAKFRPGGALYPGELLTPYFWLACMLLNVKTYFDHGARYEDWPEQHMPFAAYDGAYNFANDMTGDPKDWNVGIDTGGIFSERILSGDLRDYRMRPMPVPFWETHIKHYGGISRNHWRPEHPEIAPRWVEIKKRLARTRGAA